MATRTRIGRFGALEDFADVFAGGGLEANHGIDLVGPGLGEEMLRLVDGGAESPLMLKTATTLMPGRAAKASM